MERCVWSGSTIKGKQQGTYKYQNINEEREQHHTNPPSPVRATSLTQQQLQGESTQVGAGLCPSLFGTTVYIPFFMHYI